MEISKATEERLENENKIRAPLIKLIVDAVPIFKESDFESWSTERLTDVAGRIKENNAKAKIDEAYAK